MTKGWMKIKGPEDLERALVRMLNQILSNEFPLEHAGRFASLANSWISAKRLELEAGEWKLLKERVDDLEEQSKNERT